MTRLERAVLVAACLVAGAFLLPLGIVVRDGWHADNRAENALRLSAGLSRDAALVLTQLGAPLLLELVAVALALYLVRRNRPRLAGYVAVSVLGAEVLSYGIKLVVERVRPCVDSASCPHTTSFPSGHSVGAAAFWATMAVLLLPRIGKAAWALLAIPVVVALTRVLLGVHYPSDVIGGLLVGGCWAAACTSVLSGWRQQRVGHDVPLEEVAQ
jgi:undecaprenyl-diphosphatase